MLLSSAIPARSKLRCRHLQKNVSAPIRLDATQLPPHLLRAGVDINTLRAWLGHVSLDTTNVYAEIDLEIEEEVLARCAVIDENNPKHHWRDDPALMTFLRAL